MSDFRQIIVTNLEKWYTAEEPSSCCVYKCKLCGESEKMCREYSTQEVTVNDETDKGAEYGIILVIPLRAPKIRWTPGQLHMKKKRMEISLYLHAFEAAVSKSEIQLNLYFGFFEIFT